MSEDFIPDPSLNPDAAPDFIPDPALNANVDFIPDPSLNITPDETLAGRDEAEFIALDDLSNEWVGPKTKAPLETIEGSSEYATLVSGKKPSGFWGNLFDVSSKDMPFTGDFESAAELGKIMWIGRKIEAKEDVKDEDLVKFNTFLAMRKQQSETGWLGKAGSTVREAATFGLEIAAVSALGLLSGGTGAVAGGAEMTGAKGAVKGLRKAAEKMTDKFLVARFGEKLGGAAAKIANASGRIASDTLVLDVFRAGAIKNEIAERKLADMLAGKEEDKNAAMMSIANWSVEHASEMSGEYLGAMVSGLFNKVGGKAISSALKNETMKAQIFRAIASKFNVTRFDDVMGVMKNLGYHGVINEMYEERAGDFVRGLTGIDGKAGLTEAFKRAVPTWEQFKIESVAFAIPGIAHTAIGFTGATGVNPLELQKNFDLVSKAVANVQTRDEILKTSGDLAERIHQERANPWNRQFNFLGRLFNTANKGTAEDLLARANIKGVVEAYDAAPQGKGKEAVMDYLANKTVGIKIVDTEEQKEKALELLRDKKLVGYMYESGEGFNYYLRNKELLSDPATLKLAQETGMGFIKNVDEVDDTAIQNLEASHIVDAESVGKILSARNNADAEEIRGTLQAALKDPDIAGKIKYGLPMIIKGTRKQYEDANIGYTIAQDSKPMQDEHGDPIVDADGNNFYAMTSRGVTTNNGLILNKNSRLQDVKEEIHHLIARTALKNGQHSGEAARWAAQTRATLESIVATSQDEAKVSRAKALLGFSDFELIEKTHLYAVQDNKATDSTNMVFEAAGIKELGVLPDQRFDDYFTKLTNNKIHILRTKPRVAPAKPGVADTMVRDLVGSSVKGSVKMAKDIVGHVLETEVKDGLLVDLYLALKGPARRRNAKTPQPNIARIDQVLQNMADRGFTYSLDKAELIRQISDLRERMTRYAFNIYPGYSIKSGYFSDPDDIKKLKKLEAQLQKILKADAASRPKVEFAKEKDETKEEKAKREKKEALPLDPSLETVPSSYPAKQKDLTQSEKHKQWGDALPVKIYQRIFNGESKEIEIGEVTPDDFRNVVSDKDAARLIPQFYWDIAPVTMGEFAANFFYQYNKGRPDAPTDLKDLAIRTRIEAKLNGVNENDIPEFKDIVSDLRSAQFAAGEAYRQTVKGERKGKDDKPVVQTSGGVIGTRESAVEAEREREAKRAIEEASEDYDESGVEEDLTPVDRLIARQVQLPSQVEASKLYPPQLPESTEPFENPGKPLGFQIKNLFTFGLQLFKEVTGHKDFQGIATPYENIKVKNLSESVDTKIQKEYDRLAAELTKVATAYDDNFEQVALDFAMDEIEVERIVKLYRLTQRLKAGEDVPGISNEAKKHILRKNRYEAQRDKVLDTIQQNRVQLVIIVYDPYRDARNGYVSDLANQLAVTGRKHDAPVDLRLNRFGEEQPEYDAEGNQTGRLEKNYDAMLAGINVPMRNFVDLANSYHAGVAVLPANQALDKSSQTQIRIAQRIHDAILRNNAKNIMIIMPDSFGRNDNPEDAAYKKNVSVILKMALGEMTADKQFVAPVQAPVKERVLPADLARYAEDKQRYYQEEIDKLMKEKAANPAVQDENNPQAWAWDSLYKHTIEQMQATDRYIADEMIRREREGRPIETVADLERTALVPVQPAPATPGAISPVTKQRRRPDKLTWKEQEIVDEIDRLNAITAETPVAPGETQEPFIEYPPKIKMRLEELEEANRTRAILDSMSPESMREAARKRFGEPGARFAGMRPITEVMPRADDQIMNRVIENPDTGKDYSLTVANVSQSGEVSLQFSWHNRLLMHPKRKLYENGTWTLPKMLQEAGLPKDEQKLVLDESAKTDEKNLDKLISDVEKNVLHSMKIESAVGSEKLSYEEQEFEAGQQGADELYDVRNGIAPTPRRQNRERPVYESLSVNKGQGEYKEYFIKTPFAVPGKHGAFDDPNLAGWFRVREYKYTQSSLDLPWLMDEFKMTETEARNHIDTVFGQKPYIEINEIQSELFQKNKEGFKSGEVRSSAYEEMMHEEHAGAPDWEPLPPDSNFNESQSSFLNMLGKDQSWVPVFVQSILGDARNRGFEKVRFPTGETAARVEGHQLIEERLRDKIIERDKLRTSIDQMTKQLPSFESFERNGAVRIDPLPDGTYVAWRAKNLRNGDYVKPDMTQKEIDDAVKLKYDIISQGQPIDYMKGNLERLEDDIKRFKTEGIDKLAPVEAFYQNRVGTIVKKLGAVPVTDANGNTWNEITLAPEQQDYSLTHDQLFNSVARMLHGPERANWWQHSQDLDRQVAAIEESADPEGLIQDLVAQATVNNANTPQMIDTLAAQIRSWHDKHVNLERFGEDIEDYSLTAEDFRTGSIASLTFADDLIPITPWLFSGAHGMHDRYLELIRKYRAHVDADMMHFTKWLMEAGLHPDSKFYKKMNRTQRTVATRMLEAVGAILEGSDMVIRARSRSLSQYESELYEMYNQMQDKALELSRAGKKTEASNLAESAKDLLTEGKHNLAVWSEKGFTHEPPVGESAQRMLEEWNKIKLPGQWTAQGFRDAIRQAFDNNRRIANKEVAMLSQGEWIEELKNYITHMYKRGKAMTEQEFEEAKRKFVESSARAEKRRYPTYADAATHGLVPITQNAAQLFKMWGQKVWSLQARKLFLASAINIRDADGSPMLIAIKRPKFEGEGIIDKRTLTEADSLLRKFIDDHNAALPKSRQHEAIKLDSNGELNIDVLKELGYVQYASPFNSIEKFWVKDGAALNVMKMLLDKKKEWRPFGGRDWAKGIDTFNSFTKSALLFISAFHPFSLLESFFAAQGLTFRNDLFHLGRFYRNKQDMIKKFQTDEAFVGKWIKHGFGIGHTDPNINQGIVDQTIQSFIDTLNGDTGEEGVLSSMTQYVFDIKKGWDRWLWDEFQPALKLMTAERMLEEERTKAEAAGTKFNEDDAMEQIATVTNKMFGGVEFEKYIWATPEARQLLHALMFAPDWCVPDDTRAMTKTGFKYHYELKKGDEILVFDPKTQTTQWSKLKDMFYRKDYDAEMIFVKNYNKELALTPEHTCFIQHDKNRNNFIIKAKELNTHSLIPRCADHVLPANEVISDRLIVLAGWLVTDGYIKHKIHTLSNGAKKEYRYGRITQSKPLMVQSLKDMGLKFYSEHPKDHDAYHCNFDKYTFTIPVCDFVALENAGIENGNMTWKFMSKLSRRQLELLEETMMLGDGTGQNRFCGEEDEIFQMTLLRTLLGKPCTFYRQMQPGQQCWRTRDISSRTIRCGHNALKIRKYQGAIWCPATGTGFWMAERNGIMFITGNTFAAAEQGLITQLPLFKQMLRSPNLGEIEAAALRKFWIAMGTLVLVGIPNALQAAIYAAAGNPDDGDKPFTFQNEQGKITHIDVTPLVRMMSGVPIVGYEGGDTGKRRVYMRWGKQAYEIGGWFTEPIVTALNKSSMLVHTAWEQVTGTATSGFSEEFKDEGLLGVFSSRGEFLKGRIGSVVSKFMPMNLLSVIQDKPAGWFATASRGKTLGSVIQDMGDLLEVYADQGIAAKLKGIPGHVDKLGVLVDDVVDAGRRNGVDVEEAFKRAQNIVATKYYTIFFKALNKGDTRRMEEAAEAILRLNKGRLNIIRSMKSRLDVSGKGMTAETYSQIAAATEAARANINDQRNRGFKPPRF